MEILAFGLIIIILISILFVSIYKILGDAPDYFDFKKDHTHDNEED